MQPRENITPQQSLQLIESMIQQAKNKFSNNSLLYLLWGWVIFICSTGHFILIKTNAIENPEWIWGLTWVAVFYQIYYLMKQGKQQTVKTYADEMLSYVWVSFGVSMMITSFILGTDNNWMMLYPVILMLYGTPTFLSGAIMKFMPLKIGGVACWLLAVAASFVSTLYVLLLIALAVLVAWIIPGYLLRKYHQQQAN